MYNCKNILLICLLFLFASCASRLQGEEKKTQTGTTTPQAAELYWKGVKKLSGRHPKQAIERFNSAIAHDDKFADAYEKRGTAYLILKKPQKALKSYTKAISCDPEYYRAYYNRGYTYLLLGNQFFDKALADFNRTLQLAPDYVKALNYRGKLYFRTARKQKAMKDFRRSYNVQKNYTAAMYLGSLKAQNDKYQEARSFYNTALERKPDRPEPYLGLSRIYGALNQTEKAEQKRRKAKKVSR